MTDKIDYNSSFEKEIKKGNLIFSNKEMNILFFNRFGIPKNQRILEVGCGTGYFCNYLIENGYKKVSGCDVAEPAIRFAKHNFSTVKFSMIKDDVLPYKDNDFDVVLSFDVIEHIPDVGKHFAEVYRVLNIDGKYYFGTPQKYGDLLLNIRNRGHSNVHCSLQTKKSLRDIGAKSGFKNVKFNSIPYQLSEKQKRKLKKIGLHLLVKCIGYVLSKNIFGISSSVYLYGYMSKKREIR